MKNSPSTWYVYMVRCADKSLYTGITTDLARRLKEHNSEKGGARYTKGRQPVTLIYSEALSTRSEASKRELCLKKLRTREKYALLRKSSS